MTEFFFFNHEVLSNKINAKGAGQKLGEELLKLAGKNFKNNEYSHN